MRVDMSVEVDCVMAIPVVGDVIVTEPIIDEDSLVFVDVTVSSVCADACEITDSSSELVTSLDDFDVIEAVVTLALVVETVLLILATLVAVADPTIPTPTEAAVDCELIALVSFLI